MALIPQKQNVQILDKNDILNALVALKNGDFSYRMPVYFTGIDGKISDTFNKVMQIETEATKEVERVNKSAGEKGFYQSSSIFKERFGQ